jgi:hypothetical protein
MQVLVDRASRAQSDEEMDRFDDQLLKALSGLRVQRDRLELHAHDAQGERGADGVVVAYALPAEIAAVVGDSAGADPAPRLTPRWRRQKRR